MYGTAEYYAILQSQLKQCQPNAYTSLGLCSVPTHTHIDPTWASNLNNKKEEQPQRRKTMLENVKGYVEKHKDILFTLGLVILVDHFMFKGALRERIKTSIEGILKKAENMIEHKEA